MIKISGIVINGLGKGNNLGFPTANLKVKEKLEDGVYAGKVFLNNKEYKAGIFIREDILEAHILDFKGDLYGKKIEVKIGKKIREVMKFKSDEELMKQVADDLKYIKMSPLYKGD